MQPIIIALSRLDVENEGHWTNDGQARVDIVNQFMEEFGQEPIQRQSIIDAAPNFLRDTAADIMAIHQEEALARTQPTPPAPSAPPAPPSKAPAPPRAAPAPAEAPTQPTMANPDPEPAVHPQLAEGQKAGDLPWEVVMRSPDLLTLALADMEVESQALLKQKAEIEKRLQTLHARSDMASRQLLRIKPKENPQKAIQDYLKGSGRDRAKRVDRAKAFIRAGTTAEDVAEQMQGASKLDVVMSKRGAVPGSTRPAFGTPVRK